MDYELLIEGIMKHYKRKECIEMRISKVIATMDKVNELAPDLTNRVLEIIKNSEKMNCHGTAAYLFDLSEEFKSISLGQLKKLMLYHNLEKTTNPQGKCLVIPTSYLPDHSGMILNAYGENLNKFENRRQTLVLHKWGGGDIKISSLYGGDFGLCSKLEFYKKDK